MRYRTRTYEGVIPPETIYKGDNVELTSLDSDKVTLNRFTGSGASVKATSYFRKGLAYDITVIIDRTDCPFTPDSGHVRGNISA